MTNAVLKKSNLRNYNVIPGPGTFVVKVANAIKPEYLIDEGSKSRYIVNLRASTIEGFQKCLLLMGNKEYIPFAVIKDCFLTGVIWDNEVDDITKLPAKGEDIIATFEEKEGKLMCTGLTMIPRKELDNFDLDAYCNSRKLLKNLIKIENDE